MITVEAKDMARAMKLAAFIPATRNTLPILENVCLFTEGDDLVLVTSDLDLELEQRVRLAKSGDLSITVNARRLSALFQSVDSGAQISFECEDNGRLLVKCGASRWHLPALPKDDFPRIRFETEENAFAISANALEDGIVRTASTVSNEQTRIYFCGTYLDTEDGKLRMVSTNGHCGMIVPINVDHAPPPDLIVPPKLLAALRSLEPQKDVPIAYGDKRLRAVVGDAVLTGKAIDGVYPDYRRAWPPAEDGCVVFDPASFRAALRRVCLVSTGKTRAVKIERGEGTLTISVTDTEGGAAREDVPADCAAGHAAGFNAQYLNDLLEAVGGDTVELHQADPGSPAMIRRKVDDGARAVIMPLRI